jgi:hypothetical protein
MHDQAVEKLEEKDVFAYNFMELTAFLTDRTIS